SVHNGRGLPSQRTGGYGSLLSQGRRKRIRSSNSKHAFALAARCARVVENLPPERGRRECRMRAAPAVSCARCTRRCAHEHTGSAENIRPSLRNGLTAYAALSPATNSSCHRHRRIKGLVAPGWARKNLRRLDTSNGCQDHTVLPYAATSFVCAL
ncbi:MAG: hypothetical protein QOJ42_6134, partial [Acidobacteriaceae bacterium]|nr:hypothetical protein [Acidobacteriaceae bacterium]